MSRVITRCHEPPSSSDYRMGLNHADAIPAKVVERAFVVGSEDGQEPARASKTTI